MNKLLQLKLTLFGRRVRVPISRCVHFGAFRYGRGEEHPYETFARLLNEPQGASLAREWLVDFFRKYRPRDMGAALGVALRKPRRLWDFPWVLKPMDIDAWMADPLDLPDIVTHYSEAGVPWYRIEQEFYWLDGAYRSIASRGFRPELGGMIAALRMVRSNGEEAFLILDGNHRLSALSALGHTHVTLTHLQRSTVREDRIGKWPRVASGDYDEEDARAVFSAYFDGNAKWRVSDSPVSFIGAPCKNPFATDG